MTDLAPLDPIEALQAEMLRHPQVELTTTHLFGGGIYARTVRQPAGIWVVGKVHKREHLFQVVEGSLRIGKDTFAAPHTFVSRPGTKRAIIALTDALYTTYHRTDATSPAEAEAELVEPDAASPFLFDNTLKQEALT